MLFIRADSASGHWWRDLVYVWRDTRLLVLTAQIAAIYAAILIPFKAGIPIIPGFVELRPANAIPVVASLLFGPAAAWGAGIGNVIGDCFGTLGPASVFGFVGNFVLGYLPYHLWGRLGWLSSDGPPVISSWRQMVEYCIICVFASAACAGIIGGGVEWLGLLPFAILAPAIFLNNIVMGIALGPPLLKFLYPRVQRWQLRYEDIRNLTSSRFCNFSHPPSAQEAQKADTQQKVLVCQALSFQYEAEKEPILRHVSFSLSHGEMVLLLGRSGSGKSTICYACNGLIPHFISGNFSGSMQIDGRETVDEPVWKHAGKVGLVFQDFDTQLVATTVEGELQHPLEYHTPPFSSQEIQARVHHSLARCALTDCLQRDPLSLSGGQRQRLVLASVLVQEPLLLVLDEPGSDLDPEAKAHLYDRLQGLRKEGVCVLMTEHDEDHLAQADRVLVLDGGNIAWEGKPEDLLRNVNQMRQWGLRPLALAECFEGRGVDILPTTLEEAWRQADALNLVLHPPAEILHEAPRVETLADHLPTAASSLVHVENVSFAYDHDVVLEEVAFTVQQGEFLALLGSNGSGKSTLARLLNGMLMPSQGRILIDGMDTRSTPLNVLLSRIGLVFQNPDHQIFADTVWEEVAFSPKNFGYSEEEIAVRVHESLEAVGFSTQASYRLDPFSLRKGERQRIAVASVLAMRPAVLIFDEPTTGLDADETDRMMDMIRSLNRQGHSIVMITHSMRLVAGYAKRCVLMKAGRIIADGTPRQIFSDHAVIRSASLEIPAITRFGQRWGHTLLTVEEIKASLAPGSSLREHG